MRREVLPARATRSLWFELWTIAAACFALGVCVSGCAVADVEVGRYYACESDCAEGSWKFTGRVCVTASDDPVAAFEIEGATWLASRGIVCTIEDATCVVTEDLCTL